MTRVGYVATSNILSIDADAEHVVDTSTSGDQLGREDNAISNVWDSEW